jgi:hypothetical protein
MRIYKQGDKVKLSSVGQKHYPRIKNQTAVITEDQNPNSEVIWVRRDNVKGSYPSKTKYWGVDR